MDELTEFYTKVMNCKKGCSVDEIWQDFEEGVVPRGFYFRSSEVKILIVAKNPGHPLGCENLDRKSGKTLFKAYRDFQEIYYSKILKQEKSGTPYWQTFLIT